MTGMSLTEKLRRTKSLFWRKLAKKLPTPLAYWSYILVSSRHIKQNEVVPEVKVVDILSRMRKIWVYRRTTRMQTAPSAKLRISLLGIIQKELEEYLVLCQQKSILLDIV